MAHFLLANSLAWSDLRIQKNRQICTSQTRSHGAFFGDGGRTQSRCDESNEQLVDDAGPQVSRVHEVSPHAELHRRCRPLRAHDWPMTDCDEASRTSTGRELVSLGGGVEDVCTFRMVNNAKKKLVLVALLVLSSFKITALGTSGWEISAFTMARFSGSR